MSRHTPLHTDLYQLTMTLGYLRQGMAETPVVCEAFVRRLPPRRAFLLAAGLASIVDYLRELHFTTAQLDYLASLDVFHHQLGDPQLRRRLLELRFEGDLWAMPEGTVAFANEPLLRVEAPLWQAQLVETALLSLLNHATAVASKAARIVAAARGASVMEFGTRRTNIDAAVQAARAAYLAGCVGTSNVEAGMRYGIPVHGTMAHMWTMVHDSEPAAFDSYLATYPHRATLLVDTYDTIDGTRRACVAARAHGNREALAAVRVDSELFDADGRPTGICRRVRQILDQEGFGHTRIVVSDDLNEDRITTLLEADEPIDSFGVGTELVTSKDAPALGGVYKVVWVGGRRGRPVLKLSPGKVTFPGAHQVWRRHNEDGTIASDLLALTDEEPPGRALLQPILRRGQLVAPDEELCDLHRLRQRAREQMARLPQRTILGHEPALTVTPSTRLQQLQAQATANSGPRAPAGRSGMKQRNLAEQRGEI